MKSSEFIRVDEGLGNLAKSAAKSAMSWAGNKALQAGLGGRTRQIAAVGAQMQREKTALGQALGQQNNKNFLEKLPKDIEAAINGGQINLSGAGGGRSMEDFLKLYVNALFHNFNFNAKTRDTIYNAVTDFANTYSSERNPQRPVLSGQSLKKAQAIWDAAIAGSAISVPRGSDPGTPPAGTEVVTDKAKYMFASTAWYKTEKVVSPVGTKFPQFATVTPYEKITDPGQISELNKLAVKL
jgi:hypothetical protein